MKTCTKCHQEKEESEFPLRDGQRRKQCRLCQNARRREYWQANKVKYGEKDDIGLLEKTIAYLRSHSD